MSSNLKAVLLSDSSDLAKSLTAQLRAEAIDKEWPANVANSLAVKVDAQGISVSYPDAISGAVEDLEYGTRDSHPRAVIRMFINSHEREIVSHVAEGSVDYLFSKGILP